MTFRSLTLVLCAAGCGDVETTDGGGRGRTTTYKGRLEMTPPITFGGDPYCEYTMTLQQLEVELEVTGPGVVVGKVQNLNLEGLVPIEPPCENGTLPPKIASYTFASPTPVADGMTLTFRASPSNDPEVELTATVSSAGEVRTANLGFQRIYDDEPLLAWTIAATVTLTEQ